MANAALTNAWVEVTAPLLMAAGKSYAVEFHGPADAVIIAVDVDGAAAPVSDADGLIHFTRDKFPHEDVMEFNKRTGWTWWMRVRNPGLEAVIVSAEV